METLLNIDVRILDMFWIQSEWNKTREMHATSIRGLQQLRHEYI